MEENKYLEDLREIRQMMRKSTLFLLLSGLSGVLAGVYALMGAAGVYALLQHHYNYYPYVYIESKMQSKVKPSFFAFFSTGT